MDWSVLEKPLNGIDPELTGLEPATSAVTGRRSNQLSYNSSEKVVTVELNLGGFNRKFLVR